MVILGGIDDLQHTGNCVR